MFQAVYRHSLLDPPSPQFEALVLHKYTPARAVHQSITDFTLPPPCSCSRFNGRYDPNFGAPMMPYMPMFVPPQAMYTADFPPLGAQPGMQGGGMGMGEMSPQGGQMPVSVPGSSLCICLDSLNSLLLTCV